MDRKTIKEYVNTVIKALEDKKAEDVTVIDIHEISVLADYFIIANGTNINQVQALADNVSQELAKNGCQTKQTEGYQNANWILMDYHDFIVHIFDRESRSFYDLERIWADGKTIDAKDFLNE